MNGSSTLVTGLAILSMGLGLIGIIRAILLVARDDKTQFPAGPWVSFGVGCVLLVLSEYLIRQ